MSLFGALMGDLFDDEYSPFRAQAMQQMNRMMGGMLGADPYGMLDAYGGGGGYPRLMEHAHHNPHHHAAQHHAQQQAVQHHAQQQAQHHAQQQAQHHAQQQAQHHAHQQNQMYPFGMMTGGVFPGMMSMQAMMGGPAAAPLSHSFSSSSVMTMTTDETGRPQVYHATSSVHAGPNGVRETRKTVSDSQSGVRKMAVGHHIDERAHIVEKEKNYRTGDEEERQEFINLEEEETEDFHQEWQQRSGGRRQQAVTYPGERAAGENRQSPQQDTPTPPLAITAAPSEGGGQVESECRATRIKKLRAKARKRARLAPVADQPASAASRKKGGAGRSGSLAGKN